MFLDEKVLFSCMVYVDLNLICVLLVSIFEDFEYISIKWCIECKLICKMLMGILFFKFDIVCLN